MGWNYWEYIYQLKLYRVQTVIMELTHLVVIGIELNSIEQTPTI